MIEQPFLHYLQLHTVPWNFWNPSDHRETNAKRYQYYVRPHRAIERAFIYYLGLVIDKVISSVHWSLATKLNYNLWKLLNPNNINFLLFLDSWPTRELHFLQFSMKTVYDNWYTWNWCFLTYFVGINHCLVRYSLPLFLG